MTPQATINHMIDSTKQPVILVPASVIAGVLAALGVVNLGTGPADAAVTALEAMQSQVTELKMSSVEAGADLKLMRVSIDESNKNNEKILSLYIDMSGKVGNNAIKIDRNESDIRDNRSHIERVVEDLNRLREAPSLRNP